MMKFGISHDFRNPPRWHRPYEQLYRENLDQIVWAERLGFESVWVSEHHVTDDGYLPSVFPMLAAIAERTQTIRIGSAVLLGPFQHPIRFAHDVAVVDQLSCGRLEVGLGVGYRKREFDLLGVPISERVQRTDRLVEVARRAWANGTVSPAPLQHPEPPFWIGGSSVTAARRAARLGCHFMPDATVAAGVVALYRQQLIANGRDAQAFQIALKPVVYVCEDPEHGEYVVKDHLLYQHNQFRQWFSEVGKGSTSATDEGSDDLPRDRYIVATPDDVAVAIRAMHARTGCDRIILPARLPGLSIEQSSRSLALFVQKVMPLFE